MIRPPALQGSALEQAGAIVTETSLKLSNPTELTWDQYEHLGSFLGALGRAYPFWVGDFLVYGEEIFGEVFAQIEESLPHSEQTLMNYRSIAKHIPPHRRRATLSFSVHEAVAYIEPAEADKLLDRAEENRWKRDQMRDARRELFHNPVGELAATNSEPVSVPVCPQCGKPL